MPDVHTPETCESCARAAEVTTHWDSDCMYCFFWGQFAEAMAAVDSEWAGMPAPDHPCTDYEPCSDGGVCEMDRRARTGGATVLVLDGAATVTRVDDGGLLLQVTDYRGDESAAVVLTDEQAHDLAEALTGGKLHRLRKDRSHERRRRRQFSERAVQAEETVALYRSALERIADDDPEHQYQTPEGLRGVARRALGTMKENR